MMKFFHILTWCCILILASIEETTGEDGVSIELNAPAEFIYCDAAQTDEEIELCNQCPEPEIVDECPEPWFRIGDQCFLLVREVPNWLPWSSARTECGNLALGADLAQPRDLEVLDGLYQHIKEKGRNFWYGADFWLGGSDIDVEGEWRWNNGDNIPLGRNNTGWIDGEPNDKNGEDCLLLYPFYEPSTKSMNDSPCEKSFGFVCERMGNA